MSDELTELLTFSCRLGVTDHYGNPPSNFSHFFRLKEMAAPIISTVLDGDGRVLVQASVNGELLRFSTSVNHVMKYGEQHCSRRHCIDDSLYFVELVKT